MAADDAFAPDPTSSEDSIARYCLIGILGASGIESAEALAENLAYNPVIKGQGFLVETDDAKNYRFDHALIVHLWTKMSTRMLFYGIILKETKYQKR